MRPVSSSTKATLLLDSSWMPIGILTARASFHNLITKKVKGLDKNKNQFLFEDWVSGDGVVHYDDQPIMRSAKKEWFVPTIVIVYNNYIKKHVKRELSFKELCIFYDDTCQICLNKFPRKMLNIDHVDAKSLGGTNFTNNLTLTCKRCNAKKNNSPLPYYNVNGKELKGTRIPNNFIAIEDQNVRDEWRDFLFLSKAT